MKTIRFTYVFLLAVTVILLSFSVHGVNAQEEEGSSNVEMIGVIEGYDYDDDGKLLSVAISVDDETFIIADDTIGKELFTAVGKKVTISGEFGEDEDGYEIIIVNSYKLVTSEEDQ